jgi:hypothetical protein
MNQHDPPISTLPIERRCVLASRFAQWSPYNSPALFCAALGCAPSLLALVRFSTRGTDGFSLLHAVSGAIGSLGGGGCYVLPPDTPEPVQLALRDEYRLTWNAIACDLVREGADLHACFAKTRLMGWDVSCNFAGETKTPLLAVFQGIFTIRPFSKPWSRVQDVLKNWVLLLQSCGVDLVLYGRREKAIWAQRNVDNETTYHIIKRRPKFFDVRHPRQYVMICKRLIGSTFHPDPNKWVFWENEHSDCFAGDFWMMVERKEESMPGSWID